MIKIKGKCGAMDGASDYEYMNDSLPLAWVRATLH